MLRSRSEPGHFGRSRSRCEGPDPAPGSTLDKKEDILNDILFVRESVQMLKVDAAHQKDLV